jgi:hypothetical protein
MTAAIRRLAVVLSLVCCVVAPAFSQAAEPSSSFGFSMSLGIGVRTFNGTDDPGTWQSLSLTPDFSFGKLGVGVDVTLDYNFSGGSGNSFVIRHADWWPSGAVTLQSVAAIYLPKIAYVRWGLKGDPLFLKLGSFNDATLGDGFIMGDYNNTLFVPTERHFGLQADMDGVLFDFPYIGVETVIGNLAHMDVLGARFYVRPLVKTSIPILSDLQVGVTAAVDTQPYFETSSVGSPSPISVLGLGAMLPLVYTRDVFSLVAFTDAASIQARTWGSMVGVGGRIITIFTYGAQLRLLGPGFTATYFGPTYDTQRDVQYNEVQNPGGSGTTFGGLVSAGVSLLGDKLIFKLTLDSPFITNETDPTLRDPHLNGILTLAPGILPVFSFDFMYDKKGIGTFSQLVDATNAAVQAKLNLQSGPAVISFVYDITYNPAQTPNPTITSGLQASVALF